MAMTKTLSTASVFSIMKPVMYSMPEFAPRYHHTHAPYDRARMM